MTSENDVIPLSRLDYIPYLDETGDIPADLQGKIGVYAIFNNDKVLQYIGYSRDISLSLKQHLVRQPEQCYWLKVQTIQRPNRTLLESIQTAWVEENTAVPPGNDNEAAQWNEPIDAKSSMSDEEQSRFSAEVDEVAKTKLLKKVARKVEEEILEKLKLRGVKTEIRFNPKLKENGLLDLK